MRLPLARNHSRSILLLAAAAATTLGLPLLGAPASASDPGLERPPALVALRADAPGDVRAFARVLRSLGGQMAVAYPPRCAVILAGDDLLRSPALRAWVAEAHRGPVPDGGLTGFGPEAARAARAWDVFLTMPPVPAGDATRGPSGPPPPDALRVPVPLGQAGEPRRAAHAPGVAGAPSALPLNAGYYDTSEYMAGSVAVGVWLLEAAGSTYDWTQAEEDQTLAGVQAALLNWAERGGPGAFLTFFLDIHTGVPVSGVPIEHPQSDDDLWVDEVLSNLGYTGPNAYEKCYAYNNSIRDSFGTDWCYSIFIVDSDPTVNQGLFATGGYAWAYLGGPWIYMSRYCTWAYNAVNYWAAVPMHESGHIFLATDEYDQVQNFSGYLYASDNTGLPNCTMNQNDTTQVCPETRDQLGWRDLDSDGVIEPLDTAPWTTVVSPADTTSERSPTWTGVADVVPIPNLDPFSRYSPAHAISVATIDRVEVRVDGGPWSVASPVDTGFDSYHEAFTWTAPFLCDGRHIVEARARSSVGNWTVDFARDSIFLLPAGVNCGPRVTAPEAATVNEGAPLLVGVTAWDPEGEAIDQLVADLSDLPPGNGAAFVTSEDRTSGTLTWTPTYGDSGSYAVAFTASNLLSGSAQTQIRVRNVDCPPLVTAPANVAGEEGILIAFTVSAADPDGDAVRSLAASTLPPPATFATSLDMTTGAFNWTPFYTQAGTYSVTFTATNALTGSATTTITVADRPPSPVVTAPDTASVAVLKTLSFVVTAVDPDGNYVVLEASGLPPRAEFVDQGDNTGIFTWTPVGEDIAGSPYMVTFRGTNFFDLWGSDSTQITVVGSLTAAPVSEGAAPASLRLEPARPNPFGPRGTLAYGLPRAGRVRLVIYDLHGRRIRTLLDRVEAAGWRAAVWDGRDGAGRLVASGAYFARLEAAGAIQVRKLVMAK